jgi:hypothetical protein
MSTLDYDVLILKNGGRRDFWVSQVSIIERFVKANLNQLVRIQVADQSPVGLEVKAAVPSAAAKKAIIWDPTRGGMRMPHLHYAGEIYILNESQWAAFSKAAMKALSEKLAKVQKVTFEDVLQVSETLTQM